MKFENDELIIVINELDKSTIRKNIVQVTTTTTNKLIIKHYNQIIQKIIRFDFRENNWPELIPTIQELLNIKSEKCVLSGVSTILQIGKIFEFETKAYQKPYIDALTIFFPILTKLLNQILPSFKLNDAALIIKKVLDVYITSIKVRIFKLQYYKI